MVTKYEGWCRINGGLALNAYKADDGRMGCEIFVPTKHELYEPLCKILRSMPVRTRKIREEEFFNDAEVWSDISRLQKGRAK